MREFLIAYTEVFNYFIVFYLFAYISYLLIASVVGAIMVIRKKRLEYRHNIIEHDYFYPISIIVPMYNESESGLQCVKNLLNLDFKKYEIVVVDDGSIDNTKKLIIDTFKMKNEYYRPIQLKIPCAKINEIYHAEVNGVSITLISKDNAGAKSDAVNAGINVSKYGYVVVMDGDEILQSDCLKCASRAFMEDDITIAVGGNIKISNYTQFKDGMPVKREFGKNLLVDIQALEYSRGFIGARIFQDFMNCNLVISGGYGIFRKDAIIAVGGYDTHSMGEDMDMTMRLHRHYRKNKIKFRMKYVPESICWTQAPTTLKDLTKQRERWHFGLMDCMDKYKEMLLRPRYGTVGMFMFPYMVIFEFLFPLIMVLGLGSIAISAAFGLINYPYAIIYYLTYVLFNVLLGTISYMGNYLYESKTISFKELMYFLGIGFVDAFIFRPYVSLVAFVSTFNPARKKRKWYSPKRVENHID